MRRGWLWFVVGIGAVVVVPVVAYCGLVLITFVWAGQCGYQLIDQQLSPDRRQKAAVVEVNCGATTDFARWVVVTDAEKRFRYRHDMLAAVGGQELGIHWDGPILHVKYPAAEKPVIHRTEPFVRYEPAS